MNTLRRALRRTLGPASIALAGLALAGCASAPAERFYRLPMPAASAPAFAVQGAAQVIAIGPVGLPELFDRPQLVTGRAGVEVQLWESQRWAEPLPQGIGRALAARLALELAPAEVLAWPRVAGGEPAFRISVNVLRFDAELGRGVDDELQWSVRRLADGAQRSGRSVVRQAAASSGHEGLVVAHGTVLDAMSRDIAKAIKDLPPAEARRP